MNFDVMLYFSFKERDYKSYLVMNEVQLKVEGLSEVVKLRNMYN